ncbi:hypothetical protein BZA70DRAFT_284115 [Myxozyma melibiosi]|uniref:Uncharacterized protein n=1 Tax=Myxozyma melibiosi TaxID=54550 RepID=A0ABR1F042_9ASCO
MHVFIFSSVILNINCFSLQLSSLDLCITISYRKIHMSPPPTTHLYRALQRSMLKVISRRRRGPLKHVARSLLRNMFRPPNNNTSAQSSRLPYSDSRFRNTLQFLDAAGRYTGLERNVLFSVLHVGWARYFEHRRVSRRRLNGDEANLAENKYADFDLTMQLLGESMDMYLPTTARDYLPISNTILGEEEIEIDEEQEIKIDEEVEMKIDEEENKIAATLARFREERRKALQESKDNPDITVL